MSKCGLITAVPYRCGGGGSGGQGGNAPFADAPCIGHIEIDPLLPREPANEKLLVHLRLVGADLLRRDRFLVQESARGDVRPIRRNRQIDIDAAVAKPAM